MGIPYERVSTTCCASNGITLAYEGKGEGHALILSFSQREKEKNFPEQNNGSDSSSSYDFFSFEDRNLVIVYSQP